MKHSLKKILLLSIAAILAIGLLTGCPGSEDPDTGTGPDLDPEAHIPIYALVREEGSGTRAAFEDFFAAAGDAAYTVEGSLDMLLTVSHEMITIGYISVAFMNESVKALYIDGIAPTVENIANGSYRFTRPFQVATRQDMSGVTRDFYNFILSAEGQDIIEAHGLARTGPGQPFAGSLPPGLVQISGSSSMAPVMEALGFAYMGLNRNSNVEIHISNSATGIEAVAENGFDIGMVSFEATTAELAGLNSTTIAYDGIAIIVNHANAVNSLSSDLVSAIFAGEIDNWLEPAFEDHR